MIADLAASSMAAWVHASLGCDVVSCDCALCVSLYVYLCASVCVCVCVCVCMQGLIQDFFVEGGG